MVKNYIDQQKHDPEPGPPPWLAVSVVWGILFWAAVCVAAMVWWPW